MLIFHLILNTTHTVVVFVAEGSKALRGPGVGELGPWPVAGVSGMLELSRSFCPSLRVSLPLECLLYREQIPRNGAVLTRSTSQFSKHGHTLGFYPLTLLLSVTPQAPQELGVVCSLPCCSPKCWPTVIVDMLSLLISFLF